MFSLFYGLWNYIFSKTEFHVLILGIDKAGKTTLLEKLKTLYSNLEGLPPDRIVPTVGLNIGRIEASNTKLMFWDLGGQVGLRTIWEKYYEEAHAIIYVIDAACPSRFEDSKSALEKVLRHEDLQGAPLLILANKQVESMVYLNLDLIKYWMPESGLTTHRTVYLNSNLKKPEVGTVPDFLGRLLDGLGEKRFHHDLYLSFDSSGQDLPGAVTAEELARYLDLKELDERLYLFEAVSAYDGRGIKDAVDWLMDAMERSRRTETLRIRAGVAAGPIPTVGF